MSFRNQDFHCPNCGYLDEDHLVDLRGLTAEEKEAAVKSQPCPECGAPMEVALLKAPRVKHGNDSSPEQIARMQQSFRERFVKKEIDDVRHKKGRLFDEGLRSAGADRIKKEKGIE